MRKASHKEEPAAVRQSAKMTAKVYGIMLLTTTLTFATLTTGYQLLFVPHVFA